MAKKVRMESPIARLTKALKRDPGYRIAWKANLAMAFYDTYRQQKGRTGRVKLHKIANDAAEHFLKLICDEYKYPEGR